MKQYVLYSYALRKAIRSCEAQSAKNLTGRFDSPLFNNGSIFLSSMTCLSFEQLFPAIDNLSKLRKLQEIYFCNNIINVLHSDDTVRGSLGPS